MNWQALIHEIELLDPYKRFGKVTRVIGLMIEAKGPESSIGDVCYIHIGHKKEKFKPKLSDFVTNMCF